MVANDADTTVSVAAVVKPLEDGLHDSLLRDTSVTPN